MILTSHSLNGGMGQSEAILGKSEPSLADELSLSASKYKTTGTQKKCVISLFVTARIAS